VRKSQRARNLLHMLGEMDRRPPQIVAFGGGGFSMEAGNALLDEYVLGLTGAERPKVCFLPSASGDADHYIVRFYRAFSTARCEPSHVSLFRRDKGAGLGSDVAAHLLAQDLIYVGGGSVVSLLGVWAAHGLDDVLRRCWELGIVLCGLSAGSLCWFGEAVTAFHGPPQRVTGLGLLPYSNCVHYDGEPARRGARPTTASCAPAWRPAMRRATGPRCTSAASRSRASWRRGRARPPTGWRRPAPPCPRWPSKSAGLASRSRAP
jgi:dipeptidase E